VYECDIHECVIYMRECVPRVCVHSNWGCKNVHTFIHGYVICMGENVFRVSWLGPCVRVGAFWLRVSECVIHECVICMRKCVLCVCACGCILTVGVRMRHSWMRHIYERMCSVCVCVWVHSDCGCQNVSFMNASYGVATSSRLLKIIGLFRERALWKRLYSAKETYNFKESTNRSHPICPGD